MMKTPLILAASLLALPATSLQADTFGSGANTFTIDFVTIGNPGNGDDAGAGGGVYDSPYGGVPYVYNMGVTEVSQDWITKATNLGMTNVTAGAWTGNQPAANMTWYEAAAFVNWLNDQRTPGLKAYNLNPTNTSLTLWSSADAWQLGGENLYRHKDAYYFLPSEDEWYKAAYHKNDGVTANYWDYATGSNSIPTAVASGTTAGTAVYNGVTSSPAAVNNAGGLSAYGTMGQGGNVFEWQESAFDGINNLPSENRAFRGGSWFDAEIVLRSSLRGLGSPSASNLDIGFRVASVPEPSSTVLMIGSGLVFLARRRRAQSLRQTGTGPLSR
jgi:hypothetical protein